MKKSQIHTRRASRHPLVETVWRSQNLDDGIYLATPDGSWDLILLVRADGSRQMMIAGQATRPAEVPYEKGTSSVVISFVPGAYLPLYPGNTLLDSAEILPGVDEAHFSYAGQALPFPSYDTAEDLVEMMVRQGFIKHDPIVTKTWTDESLALSARAVQRHFVHTTGTTHKSLRQIQRAQEAVRLLQKGKKPADAAAETGYADQPHLAKSLRKIMGSTPSDTDAIHKL